MQRSYRKIHLDFHTHPEIRGVCDRFHPEEFADTLAEARVDNVVLFAKDHYGHAFFESGICPPHPHLGDDFLPLVVEACHARGIETEAYISVCCDYLTYKAHPEWACINRDGTVARWSEVSILLDLASPLIEEAALPITEEVTRNVPVDGLWFDIVMYPVDAFYSSFIDGLLRRRDIEDTHEARGGLARDVAVEAMKTLYESVRSMRDDIRVLFNNQAYLGDRRAWAYSDVIDIESDPSNWPQYDLPLRCRYLATAGKDHNALTTRFHRCWGDFGGLRSPMQLEFEVGNIFAAGTAHVSIGDHLHPSGEPEKSVYRLVETAYRHCAKVAPLVDEAKPLAELSLLIEPNPSPYSSERQRSKQAQLGATRLLIEEHLQFNVCDADADIPDGTALLLPGGRPLPLDVVAAVRALAEAGRPLIAFGNHVQGFEELALSAAAVETDLSGQYIALDPLVSDHIIGEMPIALYRKVFTFDPQLETEVLANALPPLFDETLPENYHRYGPVDLRAQGRPVIVARGNVILCGAPLPELIHAEGAWAIFLAMRQLLGRLIEHPIVRTNAGPTVEVALHRKKNDLVVHFVSSRMPRPGTPPVRMRSFEPILGIQVSLRAGGFPADVYRLKNREQIQWEFHDEGLILEVDLFEPHEVIVCRDAFGSAAVT